VLAVELDVDQVVDEVAGAGDQAEGDEGEERLEDVVGLVELAGEEQPGEDEDIFDPLLRPPRLDRRAQRRSPRHGRLSGGGLTGVGRHGRLFRSDGFHRGGPVASHRRRPDRVATG